MTMAVEIKNLSKIYDTKKAVDSISLNIKEGTLLSLLGVNGAGKTTTIKMLSGLTEISNGEAYILGKSVKNDLEDVKKLINISPQDTAVAPNLTVKENLEFIAEIYNCDDKEEMKNIVNKFSLDEVLNIKAKTLSGGWQRRLSIAMALITKPKVLFLDEPTLGLDVIARRELWKIISSLKGKITIILTTHYMEEAEELSDYIAIMVKGKIIKQGTLEEIKELTKAKNLEEAFIKIVEEEKYMRIKAFCIRNIKELLRDPLSYIFCLGFPIIMVTIMTIVNNSIPKEAGIEIFKLKFLSPAIIIFGYAFVMLFTSILISKDRTSTFLTRLYASPMKSIDFILGYTIPFLIIALCQSIITFIYSGFIGIFTGYTFKISNVLVCILVMIPSAIMFIGLGILFGTLFNEKAAPGIGSLIITLTCMMGGVFMDVDSLSGGLKSICYKLPFYNGVKVARMAVNGNNSEILKSLIIVFIYSIVIYILSVVLFKKKMKRDFK